MSDPNPNAAKRRQGRELACEGLLASQFGRRPTQAGAKAMARLREVAMPPSQSTPEFDLAATRQTQTPLTVPFPQPGPRQGIVPILKPVKRFPLRDWMALSACLTLLLGGTLYYLQFRGPSKSPTLFTSGPGVVVERNGRPLATASGFLLRKGDTIKTPAGITATIRFPDENSILELEDRAELKLVETGVGKQMELVQGQLEARITAQPTAKPLTIGTRQAGIRVVGTHFILTARTSSTCLEVLNGEVQISRLDRRKPVVIGRMQYAVAAPGLELCAQPCDERWQAPYLAPADASSKDT